MYNPADPPAVLVVGARHNSLGDAIAKELHAKGVVAYRAGIATEPIHLDCDDDASVFEALNSNHITHVVCTIGINRPEPFYTDDFRYSASEHMSVNFIKPMNLLNLFEDYLSGMPGTFVAISSNSAHVARSSSAAYCASKAALSMGLRCAARDLTRAGKPLRVWGYEPGALAGTPMTTAVRQGLDKAVAMSRMLTTPDGLAVPAVARVVARDLLDSGDVLHGCMVRLDAGEQ